jgi:phytoene dehydrogenase-like protein
MMSAAKYDAVIIGGGHNGLTYGTYLARAGKNVLGVCAVEVFHR